MIAMQGAITVDEQRRFLRFQFFERATLSDWEEARAAFLRLSETTGIRRALVDVCKQTTAGAQMDLFDFGRGIPSGMAFAVLSAPQRSDHEFVETVALNRGKNVRLFLGSEEEAIGWLLEQAA